MNNKNWKIQDLKAVQGPPHSDGKWEGPLRQPVARLTFLKPNERLENQIYYIFASTAQNIAYRVYNPYALPLRPENVFYLMVRFDRDILTLGYWARTVKEGVVWAEFSPKNISDAIYSVTDGLGVD